MLTRLPRLVADLGDVALAAAAAVANWLLGPPKPPGTTCPPFIPDWVIEESREWLFEDGDLW